MQAMWRQAKANLLSRRAQSALILLTLAAAATLLTIGLLTVRGASKPFEKAFAQSNGAHMWIGVYGNGAEAQTIADELAALPEVEASTGVRTTAYGYMFYGGEGREWSSLTALSVDPPAVSRPLLVEGRYFTAEDRDVVLLDHNFARKWGLRPGDTVEFLTAQGRRPLTVIGLTLQVESAPYPNWIPARNYIPEALLPELAGDEKYMGFEIGLRLKDPEAVRPAWTRIKALFGEKLGQYYTDWRQVREASNVFLQVASVFLIGFSVVALLSAGFIIVAAIGGAVRAQYRTIGLLKAIGFTPRQIIVLFVFENLLLGLLGALVGFLLGILISPLALKPIAEALNAPPTPAVTPALALLVFGIVLALTVLFSLWPASAGSRVNTIQAIRVGSETPRGKASRAARLAARLGLPPVVSLGVKDIFARPLRAALLAGSIAVGVLGVAFGLALTSTLDLFLKDPTLMLGTNYDLSFDRLQISDAEARRILDSEPGIDSFYSAFGVRATIPEEDFTFYAQFLSGEVDQFNFRIKAGRMFAAPGEVVVGQGLLDTLGLRVGDDMKVTVLGREVTLHIVGLVDVFNNGGRMALGGLDTLQQFSADVQPDSYFVRLAEGAEAKTVLKAVEAAGNSQLLGEVIDMTPPEGITQLRSVAGVLAVVLGAIALVSVFNATTMNVRERARDFGVFKTVGMTPGQVAAAVFAGTSGLVILTALVCLPLGVWGSHALLAAVAKMFSYPGSIPFTVNWLGVSLIFPGALAVTGLGCWLPARWAARLKVTDVLRYE